MQATHQGHLQPYLESKWGESQSKSEVLLGSSGTLPILGDSQRTVGDWLG